MSAGPQAKPLSYSVRPRALAKYLGALCFPLAGIYLPPAVAALTTADWAPAAKLAVLALGTVLAGVLLRRVGTVVDLQANEALVASTLVFLLASFGMSWVLCSGPIAYADALFEAVSGVTTTGLSTLSLDQPLPPWLLFSRSWLQWCGGLGVVGMSLALFRFPPVAEKRLAATEADDEDVLSSTRAHARQVIVVYVVLTVAAFVTLALLGAGAFPALLYTLSAVSTGGFAPNPDSLAVLGGWPLRAAALFFAFAGAVSFTVYSRSYRYGWGHARRDPELRALFIASLLVGAALIPFVHDALGASWGDSLGHAFSLAFSAQSTTGYSTMDVAKLAAPAKLVLMASMFVGGDVGATAGGIKIVRLLIFFELARRTLARTAVTRHTFLESRLGGHRLARETVEAALVLIIVYAAGAVGCWFVFLTHGLPALDSLFDVVSALGTVGLSTGVTDASLPASLKGVLCLAMLLGRLEFLGLVVLLYPRTWLGRRQAS